MTIEFRPLMPEDHELIHVAQIDRGPTWRWRGRRPYDGNGGPDVTGQIFGGINLYHFTGGPCVELVALGHVRAAGAYELSTIVAVGDHSRCPVGPCRRDR
jgi:hypothetical protein